MASAFGLGVLIRAFHSLSSNFPLNDGGLFYAMVQDLQKAGYRLPEFTSYNQAGIPFSYPPLGFYVSGLIADFTPLTLIDAFRFLPLLVTCLTIPAFYLLARSLLPSRIAVLAAVFAFALIPRTFIWLVMGGGVTRSFGLLFAILALYCVRVLYQRRRPRYLAAAVLFSSLTFLSHLETGWFLAFSIAIFFVAFGRDRRASMSTAILAAGTLALTAPWWLTVLGNHGIDPFIAAQGTGGSILSDAQSREEAVLGLARIVSTSEMLFPVIGCLGLLGGVLSIADRRYLLPLWWAAIIVLDLRAFPTFTTIPVAMMAGIGIADGLLPMFRRTASAARESGPADGNGAGSQRPSYVVASVALAALVLYASVGATVRRSGLGGEVPLLVSLSGEERAAMRWVDRETPAGSRILVIPDGGWEAAKTAEWFPLIAKRVSVATVQGAEWLQGDSFERQVAAFEEAYECGYRTASCLDSWRYGTGLDFTHVFVSKPPRGQCCFTLVNSLMEDVRYQVLYDGPGATIFAFRPADLPVYGGDERVSGQQSP